MRKGYSKRSDIPKSILEELSYGIIETKTLAEGLAIDFSVLLAAVFPDLTRAHIARIRKAKDKGITARMQLAAKLLHDAGYAAKLDQIRVHPSDTVRSLAAYLIALWPELTLGERLLRVQPLAEDAHFGVREWAWLAMRPHIDKNPLEAITLLTRWAEDAHENIRRFAAESTRPRGVWCRHIELLKEHPEYALPILEKLKEDPSTYVQNSVANWLNDAGKSQPQWVYQLCTRWRAQSTHLSTHRICQRALRNLSG